MNPVIPIDSAALLALSVTLSNVTPFPCRMGCMCHQHRCSHTLSGARCVATLGEESTKRVPQEVADQRRRQIGAHAQHKRWEVSAAELALADWTLLITHVPRTMLTLPEALVVMRLRWQIERLFHVWKHHGRVDDWRTKNPTRILCEVYAKLIGLVVQQWLLAASSWRDPKRSLFKAATIVATAAMNWPVRSRIEPASSRWWSISPPRYGAGPGPTNAKRRRQPRNACWP